MKRISIVYSQPLSQIQGINYVNNSFVMGGQYFKEQGLLLDKIYAPDATFDCTIHDYLDLIGSNVGTVSYLRERKLRVFLRELLSSKYLLGASIKMFFNHTLNARKTVKRMDEDQSDFLIFQDISSVNAYYKRYGRKKSVKSILILHCSKHPLEQSIPTFPGYYQYSFLKKRSYRKCDEAMNLVDKVVYLSKFAEINSPLPKSKKTHIFNGIEDLKQVNIQPPSKPLELVTVASVTIHKGQMNIVEALSLIEPDVLKKIHYTIVGGGNEFKECQALIKEKKLENNVTMMGPRNDVAEILKGMDVFLLPSISEGMPMSILEAMRQGLYIMATKVGGIPEMIEVGYGEFITRDPSYIASSIERLVNENVISIKNKEKSRMRFVKDFTLCTMIERYSNVLKSL